MFISQNQIKDLAYLLKSTNKYFNIIAVSKTRVSNKSSLTSNVNLNNCSFESTPAESKASGTIFYIFNRLS